MGVRWVCAWEGEGKGAGVYLGDTQMWDQVLARCAPTSGSSSQFC